MKKLIWKFFENVLWTFLIILYWSTLSDGKYFFLGGFFTGIIWGIYIAHIAIVLSYRRI